MRSQQDASPAFNKKLGVSIRLVREAMGLRLVDLANRLGLDFKLLSKLENGTVAISAERLVNISNTLGVSVHLILSLPEPDKQVGKGVNNNLAELRNARCLSGRALAARTGISQQHVSLLELGHRDLTVATLLQLASALECHPWSIIDPNFSALNAEEMNRLSAMDSTSRRQ